MSRASEKTSHPLVLAFGALALAVATPLVVGLATRLSELPGRAVSIAAPPLALLVLVVFAFHVRFALGALQAERRASSLLASIAIVIGVTGLVASILVMTGIVSG